jgi:Na+/H+-translocating membrane pyrophosphatase
MMALALQIGAVCGLIVAGWAVLGTVVALIVCRAIRKLDETTSRLFADEPRQSAEIIDLSAYRRRA